MNFLDLANPHQETLIIGKPRKKETPAPTHGRTRLPSSAPRVIGFVGLGAHARGLVPRVAGLLAKRSPVDVITDAPAAWQASSFPLQVLPARGRPGNREKALRYWTIQAHKTGRRIVVDLGQDIGAEELSGMLLGCEEILWTVEPAQSEQSFSLLQATLQAAPGLARRVRLAWVRQPSERVVRRPLSYQVAKPEFQLRLEGDQLRHHDLVRLAHHLNRLSLGLALGGGGARGAAHVGVLRVLEKAGLFVDRLAGTSMGAYIALAYAFGFSCDRILELTVQEFSAPKKWRLLPGGGLAHMAYLYRHGGWRQKCRRYFGQPTFEDLNIPACTVTADLASGRSVACHQGDAIDALLESVNFPGLSRPIIRDGMVLVDGGILNNVPSDVVRDHGANFVVAIDVSGQFKPSFGSYDAATPESQCPTALETLLRVMEVQTRALHTTDSHKPDLVIAPDTTEFGFTDYRRSHEIAERGEAAAEQALPALKTLLAEGGRPAG